MTSTTDTRITAPASSTRIAEVREQVRARATKLGADDALVEKFVLVTSELVTNVIMHTFHEELQVTVERDGATWTIDVGGASGLVNAVRTELPEPDSVGGRGLFIVNSLMDHVSIVDGDAGRSVRCIARCA